MTKGPDPAVPEPSVSQGRAFGAFRHRDFCLFWGGSVISNVGAWMQQIAQGWLIYSLTGSPMLVGLNGLFASVPFILVSLYAGTVVDRVDRRKLLICVEGFTSVIIFILGLLVATDLIEIWHIYLASSLVSGAGGFESPTRQALLPHLVPRADLMTAVSLNSIVRKGAQIIGPALGGIFVATFGIPGAYFIHTVSNLVLLLCLVMMKTTNPPSARTKATPMQAFREGLQYVRFNTLIGALLIMEGALSLFGSYQAMMVVFASDVFGTGPQGLGMLQSAAGVGSVVGSLVLATAGDIQRKGRLLMVSGVWYGLLIITFAFCPWFWVALPILACAGAMDIVFGATRTTVMQLVVPSEMLGRVMSLAGISMRGLGNLGGFQTGALTSVIGVQSAVAFGAAMCILVTIGAGIRVPEVRLMQGSAADFAAAGREGGRLRVRPESPAAAESRV